nr:MAG TPA: hypothetical protein [Caudoviricetes sp.]
MESERYRKRYSSFDRLPEKRLRSVDFPHPASAVITAKS